MKDHKITNDQCKDTGLAVILILALVTWAQTKNPYGLAAILVLIASMTAPKLFRFPAQLWFGLSHLMGEVVSKVLLTLVFFFIVTPIGLLRKLCGKDSMRLKNWKQGSDSVFIERNHTFSTEDIEKPF